MAKKPIKTKPAKQRPAKGGDPAVAAALDAYPKPLRSKLLALRKLILDTARTTDGVGVLEEALKWGQVSYLTSESKSASTIRIDQVKSTPGQYAVFFHCQTNLVERFRELYPEPSYSGNRAILFDASEELSEAELRHCVVARADLSFEQAQGRSRKVTDVISGRGAAWNPGRQNHATSAACKSSAASA